MDGGGAKAQAAAKTKAKAKTKLGVKVKVQQSPGHVAAQAFKTHTAKRAAPKMTKEQKRVERRQKIIEKGWYLTVVLYTLPVMLDLHLRLTQFFTAFHPLQLHHPPLLARQEAFFPCLTISDAR